MRAVTLMVYMLLVTACVSTSASWPAPVLGVFIDAEQRVQIVRAGTAAEAAGIQVGDILLEIQEVPAEDANAAAIEAVSFWDTEKAKDLIRKGFRLEERTVDGVMNYHPVSGPFILKLHRGDEVVELEFKAEAPPNRNSQTNATPPPADPSLVRL